MSADEPTFFEERLHKTDEPRPGDVRTPFQRDRARILHSAAFRRLQGKTQVMGVGEGDFHRTRLTHSIECAQIGNGLLEKLLSRSDIPKPLSPWMPCRDLIEAACFAHDLGHPPFGHGGEKALYALMRDYGGFEGNGQTLRIVTRLEKYRRKGWGVDPTRRLVLAVLKYPIPYNHFDLSKHPKKPPKCFLDTEQDIVDWALEGFSNSDRRCLLECNEKGKPKHRSFDCYLMELADDIAYGIHDIEDIVARRLVEREELQQSIQKAFADAECASCEDGLTPDQVVGDLYESSYQRKQMIARLVNVFVANVCVQLSDAFEHPLFRYRPTLSEKNARLLANLKDISFNLIIDKAQVQQLEQRGQRVVRSLFEAMKDDPERLIPSPSWGDREDGASIMRAVCDYVAGMTDAYAEKVYRRLFVPGFGSSGDEL
jgi:dGTPase